MINILLGKTLSGKSTISKILEDEYGIERAISITTRPKRKEEEDGKDYIFLESSTALLLLALDKLVGLRAYFPHKDYGPYPWYYAFLKKDFKNPDNKIFIIDYKGCLEIIEKFGRENVRCFYIDIDEKTQLERMEQREENSESEKIRRIKSDAIDFDGVYEIVDYKFSAKTKPETIAKKIANIIKEDSK